MQTLRPGATNDLVTTWQQFLRGQDLLLEEVTGTFDAATEDATKQFQIVYGLDSDGVVGNETWGRAMVLGLELIKGDNEDKTGPNWPPLPPGVTSASLALRQQLFGVFKYEAAPSDGNPEGIRILGNWAGENITQVTIPQLKGLLGAPASGRVSFHKSAAPQLVSMFQAWEDAGLIDRLKSFAGTWAPRFIRGSRTSLSNHSWGTAIDLNAGWNPLGARPALVGKPGCVRELVEIALESGFYWGGFFGSNGGGRPDGMHFEVMKIL
jgi:hypothetical protein